MVVAADAPFVADRFEFIGASVSIDILEAGHLIAVGGVKSVFLRRIPESEHLVLAAGEELVLYLGRITIRLGHGPNFAAARAEVWLWSGKNSIEASSSAEPVGVSKVVIE